MVPSQTIAIIGNGPSVTTGLLEAFGCETFGVNFIASVYPDTKWRPTHYLFGCSKVDKPQSGMDLVRESVKLGIPCYIRSDWRGEIAGPNVNYFDVHQGGGWPATTGNLIAGHTAVYLAAQVASLLGFRHIIFAGLDGYRAWAGADPNHLTERYFGFPRGLNYREAAVANAGNVSGYIQMVGYLKDMGIETSFVVPPERIGF